MGRGEVESVSSGKNDFPGRRSLAVLNYNTKHREGNVKETDKRKEKMNSQEGAPGGCMASTKNENKSWRGLIHLKIFEVSWGVPYVGGWGAGGRVIGTARGRRIFKCL